MPMILKGINVPFLNYLSNIRARIGQGPIIRVGGNSQENTQLYMTQFPDKEIINKTVENTPTNPVGPISPLPETAIGSPRWPLISMMQTATPEVNIDIDLLYMLNNISTFLGVNWYLGLPFAYPVNVSGISEMTGIFEQVLGANLIALQLGLYCSVTGVSLN